MTDDHWDLLFTNALIFDGSGAEPRVGDLAVKDGRIAATARSLPGERARRVIDADGMWLTPGLVDVHTHYDLEVEIEPGLPESVRHGTTTVIVSNCSLGLAFGNQRKDGADPIVDCFARVENVPKHVLAKVADRATWSDSGAYLDHFDQLALGPNIAPMIPHSMLRIEVMGLEGSVQRDPTEAEMMQMLELLEQGMEQGYVGFSTDALPFHYLANDPHRRKKIPGQYCSHEELKRLTDVVRRHGRVWQATPPKDNPVEILRTFLLSSGRLYGKPLKLTAVAALDLVTNQMLLRLGTVLTDVINSPLLQGQFCLQALAAPFKTWADGPLTPLAEEIPTLRRLNEPDLEDRAARLAILVEPGWVEAFRAMWFTGRQPGTVSSLKRLLRVEDIALTRRLEDMTIEGAPLPAWRGLTMAAAYARLLDFQRDGRRTDAEEARFMATFPAPIGDDANFFIHLLRSWDTDLVWSTTTANLERATVKRLLLDPRFLPGFADSGAHLTNMAFYDANLRALQLAAEDGPRTVAYMVRRLTRDPAAFFGVKAGTLDAGEIADLVVIDPRALARWNPEVNVRRVYREVFEHEQLVNRSDGVVRQVVIGGKLAWDGEDFTEDFGHTRMGRLLTAGPRALAREGQARRPLAVPPEVTLH